MWLSLYFHNIQRDEKDKNNKKFLLTYMSSRSVGGFSLRTTAGLSESTWPLDFFLSGLSCSNDFLLPGVLGEMEFFFAFGTTAFVLASFFDVLAGLFLALVPFIATFNFSVFFCLLLLKSSILVCFVPAFGVTDFAGLSWCSSSSSSSFFTLFLEPGGRPLRGLGASVLEGLEAGVGAGLDAGGGESASKSSPIDDFSVLRIKTKMF